MCKRLYNKSFFIALMLATFAVVSGVHAESWIPIKSGEITIFIPQYNFKATKVAPGQYTLSWNNQSGATSYKIDRLAADPETSATADEIQTIWQTVAEITNNSFNITHDLATYDLAGHQNYRLLSCQSTICTEIGALSYFVSNTELQEAIPQDFTLTTETSASAKVSGLSAQNDNPYEYGYGYSYVTGHDDPSGETVANSKISSKNRLNSNNIITPSANVMSANNVRLAWKPVRGATHYVVSKIPDRGESPTFNRLYGEVNNLHAKSTSFNLGLSAGTYKFVVYACSGYGFCGLASASVEKVVTITPDPTRQPKNLIIPEFATSGVAFHLRWGTPDVTAGLTHYEVAGELGGIIGTIPANQALEFERNNSTSSQLASGRQYCYKVRAVYSTGAGQYVIPDAPNPHCVKVGGEPILPAPANITLVGEVGDADIHSGKVIYTTRVPTLLTGYSISWGAVAGASYYQLDHEIIPGSGNWSPVYVGTIPHHQQHFSTNAFEAYRVSACKSNGYCGNYQRLYFDSVAGISSSTLAKYKKPACLNVPSSIGPGETIPVSWCAPQTTGVASYEMTDISGTLIHGGPPSFFNKTLQGLVASPQPAPALGNQYCYTVKAYFPNDASSYSTSQKCGTVKNKAAMPVISPASGDIYHITEIGFSSSSTSAEFEYAVVPVAGSCDTVAVYQWKRYTGSLTLADSARICARATRSDLIDSDIAINNFTVVNLPPQITSSPAQSTIVSGSEFSYQVTIEDTDSSTFTYELTSAPAGMTVNTSGLVSWTPIDADIGDNFVTLKVTDLKDADQQTFALTVIERPPISAVDIANLNAQDGSFRVNWLLNSAATSVDVVEEFNGVWGSPLTVNNATYKDYSAKPAGRYRYKVGDKVSAAFTLSTFTPSAAVSSSVDLTGLSGDVGFTAGQFRVSESGAATYSVPLNLPAGVAGVKPQVSLNYSSQGGDSNMGRGWSLAVGGAISRCPANMFHNGDISGIGYDDTDLFCLNSQQLVLKAGSYGAAGSTYYTAIDGFSIITAHGNAADSGPNYFTVETKSGDTYYYGQTTDANDAGDAFVEPNTVGGNNAMAKYWALKKLVDVSGNAILYHYNEETATGVHALTSLEYGKNEGVSTSRYFNKVTFNYIDDPKPRVGYSGGSMVVMDQLLDSISITVDDSSYRYYELNYDSSNIIEERTYLESVRECLAQNSHCLSPLSFTWERPPTAGSNFTPFAASTGLTTSSKGRQFARTIDINADGYSDIVYEDDGWYAVYGPSFDNTPQFLSSIGSSDADRSYARTIDYDGDGKQELLVANGNPGGTNGNWTVLSFNNGSFQPVDLGRTAIGLAGAAQIMDIDGDGLQDIMYKSGAQLAMYRNQGNGQFSGAVVLTAFNSGDTELHFDNFSVTNSPSMKNSAAIDGDGDGRTDLLSRMTSANWYCDPETAGNNYEQCTGNGGKWVPERSYGWRLLVSSGTLAAPQLTEFATIDYDGEDLRATDFNGDGLTDVVYHKDSNDTWYYRLSNGKGFGAEHQTTHTSPDDAKHEIFFIDLNSDGRADILKPTSKTSWDILLSRPSTSSEVITWEKRGTLARDVDDSILFGDVDGDGKVDLVTSDNDNGWQVQYADRRGIIDNVITDFTNGWGVSTTVTYETLLNDTVKIAGLSNNVIADTLSPVSAMTVVKKVESDSNINSRVAVDYRYGGMLLHRKGLGSLGFKQLNTTDAQSGVQTNTTYSQEYPYVGMPLTTQQTAAGLVISSATNSLSQIATTSNGGTFPYISSVEDKQYQIGTDGSYHTLARTVTSNSYDGWGNLTGNTVTINDGYTLLHTTTSSNNFGTANSYEQQKGRLLSSTVTKVQGSQPAINRTSTFGYYASGSICDGVTQPQGMLQSSSVNGLTTTTCYNVFGHKARVSKSGKINDGDSSVTTITSSSTFSADGRSVASTTNNLGHTTTLAYNGISATGTVTGLITKTSATDVNGLTVINHIDTWGKTIATESPFSPVKTTQTAYCSSCGTNGKYYVETRQAGTPTKRVVIDSFGREVEARVQHFNNGSYSYSFKDYDNQGRLLKAYLPTTTGNRGYDYTLNSYDNYGRVTRVTQANGNSATVTLAGLVTIKTDPKGNTSTETANLLGQLVSVNDSIGGILTYTYNAYGNMLTASKSSDGTDILQVSNTFNSYGQKTATTDIDKGTWQFRYNDFGKQVWQQSANTDATTTEFDSSGRKNRVSSFDFTQCWIYGTAADANANGKLIETKYFDSKSNKACTATDFNQRSKIAYDSVGRASHTTQTINNLMDPLNGEYHAFSEFDSYGRLHKQHYA
ncbi:MAG: YD repeat-containing protein, partial [Alteromonadaceae bacterium]